MDEKYQPQSIETRWQKQWEKNKTFAAGENPQKQKYYLLEMFPYPSGRIHMGHVRNYTIGDVIARYKRMKGFHVLHPMGWDAFGMPAENAAIQNRTHPAKWTRDNINTMRDQLKRLGFSYDWSREVNTSDPAYYRWEQLFFLQMWERGLVFRKESLVNWCETCQTVLANEQVLDGHCWRCEMVVAQKPLEQWFFKITNYADELLSSLEILKEGWPERVLTMQREWIGRSQGATIDFPIEATDQKITVFTTRPDTLFGATFMSLAPENPLVEKLIENSPNTAEVRAFVAKAKGIQKQGGADYEKEGIFTGAYCLNPVVKRQMPIYVTNFVVMEYGTGAVMAVPAHDQRDFDFAHKYKLPVILVITPAGKVVDPKSMEAAFEEEGVLVNSGQFSGMKSAIAKLAIVDYLERKKIGRRKVQYKLRDWGISRQRYWGTPIPAVYCPTCGVVPAHEEDLPIVLPPDVQLTGREGSPLARHESFLKTACPKCGGEARRETDTMDTFVESSWYFFRYVDPQNTAEPFNKEKVATWCPVDQYIGGIEHAVLHLLYSRFFTQVLRDLGYLNLSEPFERLLTQGMVIKEGAKMSKSRGNVVDPNYLIDQYGADTARLFVLFASPPERDLEWSDQGVEGCFRFLNRVWRLVYDTVNNRWPGNGDDPELAFQINKTIKKVTDDIEKDFHFNTAIAAIMELVNYLAKIAPQSGLSASFKQALKTMIVLISPMVPHIAEEMGEVLGIEGGVSEQPWPSYDETVLEKRAITVVVQVNGKVRAQLSVAPDSPEDEIKTAARAHEKIIPYLEGKNVAKTVYVPGRLVNFVVS
ncbi:MAG: leucine--tRNA ligase [Deltaproteobacteria bacterium]|nr:leucine--tRNA ligase [Deltaproteobacteria bacterium]